MSTLTIHGAPQSTYVRTARMTALEKGVDHELVPAAPNSEPIAALHPFAKIPAMRHGEVVLWETVAITRYIDEVFDGPALLPAEPDKRALAAAWISAVSDYIYPAMIRRYVLQYLFPKTEDGAPDRAVIDAALPEIEAHLARIDAQLARSEWLGGDAFSLADCFVAPILFYVARMPEGGEMLSKHANIARAGAAMHERASFVETLPPAPKDE